MSNCRAAFISLPPTMGKASSKSAPIIRQRQPSVYMLIGAIWSASWFFALPLIKKSSGEWHYFYPNVSPATGEVLLNMVSAPYFLAYCLVVALPVYWLRWPFFDQFKISKEPWPWFDEREDVRKAFRKLTIRSIGYDAIGFLVYLPLLAFLKTQLLPSRALSFSLDDWPSYWELARDNFL